MANDRVDDQYIWALWQLQWTLKVTATETAMLELQTEFFCL